MSLVFEGLIAPLAELEVIATDPDADAWAELSNTRVIGDSDRLTADGGCARVATQGFLNDFLSKMNAPFLCDAMTPRKALCRFAFFTDESDCQWKHEELPLEVCSCC